MTAWKTFVKSTHELSRWILGIIVSPFISALFAVSDFTARLGEKLEKI